MKYSPRSRPARGSLTRCGNCLAGCGGCPLLDDVCCGGWWAVGVRRCEVIFACLVLHGCGSSGVMYQCGYGVGGCAGIRKAGCVAN